MKKLIQTGFVILIMWSLQGCGEKKAEAVESDDKKETIVPVKVIPIVKRTFIEYGSYYGDIAAIKEATVLSYAGGRINSLSVKIGSWVKTGDELADVDGESKQLVYESAKLAYSIAQQNYERAQAHFEEESISSLQLEQSHLAQLQAKQQFVDAEKIRNGAFGVSPLDGIIIEKHVNQFEDISPNSPLYTIAQLHRLKIITGIPEAEIMGVKKGNKVQISLTSFPERVWKGKVHSVSQKLSGIDRTFKVVIYVENKKQDLKPGVTAKVSIEKRIFKNSLVLPTQSIMVLDNKSVVFIVKNDVAVIKGVNEILNNLTESLVKGDLTEGDLLVTAGQGQLSNDSKVKIIPANNK